MENQPPTIEQVLLKIANLQREIGNLVDLLATTTIKYSEDLKKMETNNVRAT